MKMSRTIMGMPVTIDIADAPATAGTFEEVFAYLTYVDDTFSTYKKTKEIKNIKPR